MAAISSTTRRAASPGGPAIIKWCRERCGSVAAVIITAPARTTTCARARCSTRADTRPETPRGTSAEAVSLCSRTVPICSLLVILEGRYQTNSGTWQPMGGPFAPVHLKGLVTNMESMFKNCSWFSGMLGGWWVSQVTSFAHMFDGAQLFTGRPAYIPPVEWPGHGVQEWIPNPKAVTAAMFGTTPQDAEQAWAVWGGLPCWNNGSPLAAPPAGAAFFFNCLFWPAPRRGGSCCYPAPP